MPPHFALASSLVGAAMNDLTHEDMMQQYANPREYQDKWIYPTRCSSTSTMTPSVS